MCAGASDATMLVGDDRNPFSSIAGPEMQWRSADDAVGYQLIDVGGNETSSGAWKSLGHHAVVGVNHNVGQSLTKPPKSVVSTSSVTSALRHAPGSVNVSSLTTSMNNHDVRASTTASESTLRLETALASRTDGVSGDYVATGSTYYETEQSTSSVLASNLRTTDNIVDTGSRKRSLLLTISGESRLRSSSSNRLLDVNASAVTVTASRNQDVDQLASTAWLPEVDNTTESGVENGTDAQNVAEPSDSTAIRVRYVHTLLTEDGGGGSATWLGPTTLASITGACAFCFLVVVIVVIIVYRRRCRRTSGRSKVGGSNGGKPGVADEKLKVLRRAAADSDTLSPDLLDQIIRAELARGRAKRYRARLRDGDDREQLERLAVELSDDWGTPPPSYRRLTPVTGPTHRRPLWPTDSPARVHDLRPPPPDLPPPIPERSFVRPTAVPLDFRQFRRPLPEVPRQESADRFEMALTPNLSEVKPVRCLGPHCDVVAASLRIPCDVIRSPLPVSLSTQDGGTDRRVKRRQLQSDVITASQHLLYDVIRSSLPVSSPAQDSGSEKRRRFPKMGRSCLLESLQRHRGDSVDVGQCPTPPHHRPPFHARQSTDGATGCACAADLCHPAVTSWTRDLSHLPILRDTTVWSTATWTCWRPDVASISASDCKQSESGCCMVYVRMMRHEHWRSYWGFRRFN